MKPIHHRNELLALTADLAPTNACRRAVEHGTPTVLGGFAPAGGFPQWIVHVKGVHQEWYVCIIMNTQLRRHQSKLINKADIPWDAWIGNSHGTNPLLEGDNPAHNYMEKVLHESTKNAKQTSDRT